MKQKKKNSIGRRIWIAVVFLVAVVISAIEANKSTNRLQFVPATNQRNPTGGQPSLPQTKTSAAPTTAATPIQEGGKSLANPSLEFVSPAPGCPEKVPTFSSVLRLCQPLDAQACRTERFCNWPEKIARCFPNPGSHLLWPDNESAGAMSPGGALVDLEPVALPKTAEYLSRGGNFEAKGEYAEALAEYTRALDVQSDFPAALSNRARVYQRNKETSLAIRDYCSILAIVSSSRGRRAGAREWIAELTRPQGISASASTDRPSTDSSSSPQGSLPRSARLEFVAPGPGCEEKLPTYDSAKAFCTGRNAQECKAEQYCDWSPISSFSAACLPRLGTNVRPVADFPGMIETFEITTKEASDFVSKGDAYLATNKVDKAIAEFSKALKALPNDIWALRARAGAFEKTGDKRRAIADYCRVAAVAVRSDTRKSALDRLANLAGQPVTPTATQPDQLDNRPTAVLRSAHHRRNAIAPLSIETDPGLNYLIKLVNVANPQDQIIIYVKGGDKYSTKIPLGDYLVRGASGYKWYGEEDYFGPTTNFFRFKTGTGNSVGKPLVTRFTQEGNIIRGHTMVLKNTVEGNMSQETISKNEF